MLKLGHFAVLCAGLGLMACSDSTSPGNAQTETLFDVQVERVETFEDVDIHIMVEESGGPLHMEHGEMHIQEAGGSGYAHEMEAMGDGWVAHAMFFEPGIHELHFQGRRHGGGDESFGDHMIEVHRQHRLIGGHWAELALDPAPIVDGSEATITLNVFEIDGQSPGAPATGLTLEAHLHNPDDVELPADIVEGAAWDLRSAAHVQRCWPLRIARHDRRG